MASTQFDIWFDRLALSVKEFTLKNGGHPFTYFAVDMEGQQIVWLVQEDHLLQNRNRLATIMMAVNIAFDTACYAVAFEAWGLPVAPGAEPTVLPSESERRVELVEVFGNTADGRSRNWLGQIARDTDGKVISIVDRPHSGRFWGRFADLYPDLALSPLMRQRLRDLLVAELNIESLCVGRA